jgi:hypothetical protein
VSVPCAVAFGTNASSVNTESYVSGRVDYNINDKQKIYFRLSRDWGIQASATSPISPIFNQQSNQPWTILQVNYTYSITPNLVNNFIASGTGTPPSLASLISPMRSRRFQATLSSMTAEPMEAPTTPRGLVLPTWMPCCQQEDAENSFS